MGPARNPTMAVRSLRDDAYEEIKRRILTCAFRPGEVLSEAQVAAALAFGRTPVRQAFDRLMRDGLVDVLPRKGIVVRPISQDEIEDLVEMRLLNESHCARRAAERIGAAGLAELDDLLEQSLRAVEAHDVEVLMELDRAFHAAMAVAAGNVLLADILRNLHERSQRVWFVSLRVHDHHDRVHVEHAAIRDALRAHDADGAATAMRSHIRSFDANLRRQL